MEESYPLGVPMLHLTLSSKVQEPYFVKGGWWNSISCSRTEVIFTPKTMHKWLLCMTRYNY